MRSLTDGGQVGCCLRVSLQEAHALPLADERRRRAAHTINDACGYMLAMPKRRKLRAPWKYPGGYSCKKRVHSLDSAGPPRAVHGRQT
jgi:hypothetical protein